MARSERRSGESPVQRVTSARESLSVEQSRRTRRYLISMSIRTACFIGCAVAVMLHWTGWLPWAFVAGSVVLPYVAVVAANAGRENDDFRQEWPAPASPSELPAHSLRIIRADDD
jgi:hypothetical protein